MTTHSQRSSLLIAVLAIFLTVGWLSDACAQSFVSPLIGFNFGGDANCPDITNCTDKRMNAGVALGALGKVFGFEEEFAYAKDFFGETPGLSSSVLTVMSNVMLVPRIGPVRPYALAGAGLVKTHVEFTPSSVLTGDNNNFGWDLGGGLMVLFSRHVGVRGDIRYFHSFQSLNLLLFTLDGQKLDFGRASGALMLTF